MTKLSLVCCYEKPAPVSGFPRLPADEALVDLGFYKSAAMDGRFRRSATPQDMRSPNVHGAAIKGHRKNCAAATDGRWWTSKTPERLP
ncbi:MAG TPA: hypothetical protein VJ527_02775 [Rhodanobacter sp.]|nr:hypothetical protein [Rhodanobacter sp.]